MTRNNRPRINAVTNLSSGGNQSPVLSIVNNDHHPSLSGQGAQDFIEAKQMIDAALVEIQTAYSILRHYQIELAEVRTACHLLNSTSYIIDETLDQPKNHRIAAYAESRVK